MVGHVCRSMCDGCSAIEGWIAGRLLQVASVVSGWPEARRPGVARGGPVCGGGEQWEAGSRAKGGCACLLGLCGGLSSLLPLVARGLGPGQRSSGQGPAARPEAAQPRFPVPDSWCTGACCGRAGRHGGAGPQNAAPARAGRPGPTDRGARPSPAEQREARMNRLGLSSGGARLCHRCNGLRARRAAQA
jgi:hypothetical protein